MNHLLTVPLWIGVLGVAAACAAGAGITYVLFVRERSRVLRDLADAKDAGEFDDARDELQ